SFSVIFFESIMQMPKNPGGFWSHNSSWNIIQLKMAVDNFYLVFFIYLLKYLISLRQNPCFRFRQEINSVIFSNQLTPLFLSCFFREGINCLISMLFHFSLQIEQ